jgi:ubiquinone/menaquinone biosynthesis C-methylase UbiE
MASMLDHLTEKSKILDLGAGYGGSARHLARSAGCQVICLNISDVQNERNRQLCQEQGLADKVTVKHGSFESIPCEDKTIDVVWSQDAFLHSGNREVVLREIYRVLEPQGQVIFTDPMQADDCPPGVLQPVYDRLSLNSLGSFAYYRRELSALGFADKKCVNLTDQLRNHYARVGEELKKRAATLRGNISQQYLDKMLLGLENWVSAADTGYLAWGILHFQRG